MPEVNIIDWNWEFKDVPKGKNLTIKPGIDHLEILKDEKLEDFDRYVVIIKKDTVMFNLEGSYEFKYSSDEIYDDEVRNGQIRDIVSLEANLLSSIFLRFNNLPPLPLFFDIEGNEDDSNNDN